MLIVVKTPYTVRASWLQEVSRLDLTHEEHVLLKDAIDCWFEVFLLVDPHSEHAEEERYKVKFVTCSVIQSLVRAKRL